MKLLILISMLIIFISVIFILFIVTDISKRYMECSPAEDNKIKCSLRDFGLPFVFGLMLMGVFVLIDILVVYFLYRTLTARESIAYP